MLTLLLVLATFGPPSPAGGSPPQQEASKPSAKHETIFARLDHSGDVSEVYVVNTFLKPAGKVVDYGGYADLVNLTDQVEAILEGERITFTLTGEDTIFRYQGMLTGRELPWKFAIDYFLDGKSIEPENLAGASGRLKIEAGVKQNPQAHRYFTENFMLQLSIPLEKDKATIIVAPAATQIYVGSTVTLVFTVLPGSGELFYVEADVRDFTMEGINIAAMRAAIPLHEMLADLDSGFDGMAAGMEALTDGAKKLQGGLADLHDGAEGLYGGVVAVNNGARELANGMDGYAAGMSRLTGGLDTLGTGAAGFNNGLSAMTAALPQLVGAYGQVEDGLKKLLANKEQAEQLAAALAQNPDPQVRMLAKAMLGQLAGLGQLQSGLQKANEGLSAHSGALSEVTVQFKEFEHGLQKSRDGARELEHGLGGIKTATHRLSGGMEEIKNGTWELRQNMAALPEAVQKLIDGQKEMKDGVKQAQNEMAQFNGDGRQNETVSFVSPGKANAKSVQFVFRTAPVETGEMPVAAIQEDERKSIWQRFLHLFRQLAHNLTAITNKLALPRCRF
jgi:X-X-X-Leu-X-X-Gly heptad repeat protein